MPSGDPRSSRPRPARDPAQGSLDGLLSGAPDARADEAPRREAAPAKPRARAKAAGGDGAPTRGGERLADSLDRLEESVTLLLARHAELAATRAEEEKRRAERESLDPIALRDRVEELEEERARLDRHAAFLEERIRGLLSRVRYVMES